MTTSTNEPGAASVVATVVSPSSGPLNSQRPTQELRLTRSTSTRAWVPIRSAARWALTVSASAAT